MNKDLRELGSQTARNGFKNEKTVADKFNSWQKDKDAQQWLEIMGYKLKEIEKVEAKIVHGYKTDVQVQITIYLKDLISAENLSIKLVSNPQGFNQVDKRWVDNYIELWEIPSEIVQALKLFTGEMKSSQRNLKDSRRMFISELDTNTQKKIIDFFEKKKVLVVSDILKGRGQFSAGWMLVAMKNKINNKLWTLKSINHVINHYSKGNVVLSPRGSLLIGRITMQRKGGDGGRDTANMLQFKMNPAELFDI